MITLARWHAINHFSRFWFHFMQNNHMCQTLKLNNFYFCIIVPTYYVSIFITSPPCKNSQIITEMKSLTVAACASCNNNLQFAKINVLIRHFPSKASPFIDARCTSHAPRVLFRSSVVSGPQFNLAGCNYGRFILKECIYSLNEPYANDILVNVCLAGRRRSK